MGRLALWFYFVSDNEPTGNHDDFAGFSSMASRRSCDFDYSSQACRHAFSINAIAKFIPEPSNRYESILNSECNV